MLVDLQSPPYKLLSASATTISRNHCQLLPPHQKYNERGHGSIEKCSAYLSRGKTKNIGIFNHKSVGGGLMRTTICLFPPRLEACRKKMHCWDCSMLSVVCQKKAIER